MPGMVLVVHSVALPSPFDFPQTFLPNLQIINELSSCQNLLNIINYCTSLTIQTGEFIHRNIFFILC